MGSNQKPRMYIRGYALMRYGTMLANPARAVTLRR